MTPGVPGVGEAGYRAAGVHHTAVGRVGVEIMVPGSPAVAYMGTVEPMADPSFDVVSKVDRQEVDNALNQTAKELSQRFDFRGTNATIAWAGEEAVTLQADSEERVKAALDVFKEKLIKRGISMKALDAGDPQSSGKVYKVSASIKNGIEMDEARKIAKLIRDEGGKGVQAQIQGDQLRVSAKKKDDLQAVIAMLKAADLDVPLQFTNYR
jgi:uncharacterized protein YajQ (UPF0234 family)